MPRVAYLNGRFVPHARAAVHIEDRGYQFADGVYEVWAVFDGRLSDAAGHFKRLARSLGELRIASPMSERALKIVLRETLRRNAVRDGLVYLQVTRGVAPRDHAFPNPPVAPGVVITAKSVDRAAAEAKAAKGAAVSKSAAKLSVPMWRPLRSAIVAASATPSPRRPAPPSGPSGIAIMVGNLS